MHAANAEVLWKYIASEFSLFKDCDGGVHENSTQDQVKYLDARSQLQGKSLYFFRLELFEDQHFALVNFLEQIDQNTDSTISTIIKVPHWDDLTESQQKSAITVSYECFESIINI